MRTLAWDEPLVWVTWKVVAVPAGGGVVPRDGEGDAVLACGCGNRGCEENARHAY